MFYKFFVKQLIRCMMAPRDCNLNKSYYEVSNSREMLTAFCLILFEDYVHCRVLYPYDTLADGNFPA